MPPSIGIGNKDVFHFTKGIMLHVQGPNAAVEQVKPPAQAPGVLPPSPPAQAPTQPPNQAPTPQASAPSPHHPKVCVPAHQSLSRAPNPLCPI